MLTLTISLSLIALLVLWVAVRAKLELRRRRRMRSEVSVLVERMFGRSADSPALEFGWSFGHRWPLFTLLFPTAEARSRLMDEETIREFASQLEKIVVGIWPRKIGL
jgi:hypothetical protein